MGLERGARARISARIHAFPRTLVLFLVFFNQAAAPLDWSAYQALLDTGRTEEDLELIEKWQSADLDSDSVLRILSAKQQLLHSLQHFLRRHAGVQELHRSVFRPPGGGRWGVDHFNPHGLARQGGLRRLR